MEQVEQSQQPLKPEAVWQHHQPVSTDGPPAVDPSASASSAFSPAQIPYTDSNTLALLQSWYAYYAQQHRALQTAQAQTGNPEGAFHPPGPSDPALAATLPHILSSLAPRPDGSAADAITHATPGSAGPGPPLPLVSSGVSPPVQGLAHANGLLRRPSAVDSLEQTAGVSGHELASSIQPSKEDLGPGVDGAASNSAQEANGRVNGVKCAKEKNRQAQRRFRERQKGLISALKERADALTRQVEEQARTIDALEKENLLLKAMMGDGKSSLINQAPQAPAPHNPPQLPVEPAAQSQHGPLSQPLPMASVDTSGRQ